LSSNKEPDCSDTLAAAYARAGDFQRAVELQIKALANPTAESDAAMQERLRLYRAGKAWPPD